MKKIVLLVLICVSGFAYSDDFEENNFYVTLRNTYKTYIQGYYNANFEVTNSPGGKYIDKLTIKFSFVGDDGVVEYQDQLVFEDIDANRYNNTQEGHVEAKDSYPSKMVVDSVIAIVDGKRRDLLKEGRFGISVYEPLPIELLKKD